MCHYDYMAVIPHLTFLGSNNCLASPATVCGGVYSGTEQRRSPPPNQRQNLRGEAEVCLQVPGVDGPWWWPWTMREGSCFHFSGCRNLTVEESLGFPNTCPGKLRSLLLKPMSWQRSCRNVHFPFPSPQSWKVCIRDIQRHGDAIRSADAAVCMSLKSCITKLMCRYLEALRKIPGNWGFGPF